MIAAVRILLALGFALAAPRLRGLVLALFALAIVLGGAAASLISTTLPIALFALILGAATFLALVLPRLLPRLFIALACAAALPLLLVASWHGKLGFALAVLGLLAVFVLAVRKPDWMMRLAGASAGALALSGLFPQHHALLVRFGLIALLFGLEEAVRKGWPERAARRLPIKSTLKLGAALGAAAMLLVVALPLFATTLPAETIASERPDLAPIDYATRRAALLASAPRGGLVWPLPSEAITWDEPASDPVDRALFPFFDNLDALYLGVRTRGLVAVGGAGSPGARHPGDGPHGLGLRWLLARVSLHKPIAALRLVHDGPSLVRLEAAAQATVLALQDLLPLVKPGTTESALEAAMKQAMRRHGCGPESFPLIFTSGAAAAEPHGAGNAGVLRAGELLVADVGCQVDHYASDFTRTLPVSGTFTARQRTLYEAVLAAQDKARAACKPGAHLSRGGAETSLEDLARAELKARAPDHETHMTHSLGHTVGLFVHDIYLSGALRPANVITLEPGTYLPGELGIRIEDTFVVTADACEPLTTGFPAQADAIEARLRASQTQRSPAP